MPGHSPLDNLRLLLAVGLLITVGSFFVFGLGEGADGGPTPSAAATGPSPGPSLLRPVEVGGEVVETTPVATQSASPPSTTPAPATPEPTPRPTPAPAGGFQADILLCRSISGTICNGEFSTLPPDAGSFVALVLLEDTRPGDVIEASLIGPGQTIPGGPTRVQGGDGYYFTTFAGASLPAGEYRVVATRNGNEVDEITFTR